MSRKSDHGTWMLWCAAGLAAALGLSWALPRAFPFLPRDWQVSHREARTIALDELRDLGELPPSPFVITELHTDPALERRLQLELAHHPAAELRASPVAGGLVNWRVTVFAPGARASDWSYRAQITPAGRVTELRLRVPPDSGSGEVDATAARGRADRFLATHGFDLARFGEPEIRRNQLDTRTDLTLRYRDRQGSLGDGLTSGVEVSFAGDRLAGFSRYFDDPGRALLEKNLQIITLLSQLWIFLPLPLLPLVAIFFLRRYHAGEVGVRRGLEILAAVLASGALLLVLCGKAAAAGWAVGLLTRTQVTAIVVFQLFLLIFVPLGLLAFLSWSVGESLCRERWGSKLAAFDAFFKRDWGNATFAWASLRGLVAGVVLTAGLLLLVLPLSRLGAWPALAMVFGPWWENSSWFALSLLGFAVAYGLYQELFGRLLLVSGTVRWLGVVPGAGLAAVVGAVLFFPPLLVIPLAWSLPFALLAAGVLVGLFLRFGIFTALLASVTHTVLLGVLPFLVARDPWLELQAGGALLLVALPLLVSVRHLVGGRRFVYRYEDVPPHVRRIAERERQRVELETARRIQSSILPELPPQLGGVEIAHSYLPATEVGGDFYDVLALEDGRLALAVGDVAGHGVSSGLVMSMAKSALAVQVSFDPRVEAVFRTLNRTVYQTARKRLLSTLCYALLDPERRELLYASAGHLFPYLVRGEGGIEALESVAYPLGVREDLAITVRRAHLAAGDSLFFFSDGVVEARRDGSDDLFGFERLEESLRRHAGECPAALRDRVLEDVFRFTGPGPREDDVTLLVLRVP